MSARSTGAAAVPGLFVFLPELIGITCACLEILRSFALQYLQEKRTGGPGHCSPSSVGLAAYAPQVVQSHFCFPRSRIILGVWLSERSPLAILFAALWIHFRLWKAAFHLARLVFPLVLQGDLTSLFHPRWFLEDLLHLVHSHPPPSLSMKLWPLPA